jgi:adenine-specific DNA-methyltransferase
MEPLRAELNRLLGQQWEEWEIPRELDAKTFKVSETLKVWEAASELHAEWWQLRRARQAEIDASIARRADTETLYDQPYSDNKRVRVSGPFTVESLSPHRVIAPDEERPASQVSGQQAQAGRFEMMILDNLKKAGVQNTYKNERLTFDRLEPYAGEWLQGEGEYTEKRDGKARRVAVAIGPEHGTVGPQLIKEAAKEAVRGVGFDLLIVCGFAFDPHVAEEATRYGKLAVLTARMNPDLAMGDTLLKKTGAGNLFMVFGEPDIVIRAARSDDFSRPGAAEAATTSQIVVEIRGLDIYDPTTGEIRSSSTEDIACWFIDTDYNEETFFVRHAYFTGGDRPYDKLQRALRAEIDEDAWSALYSTVSRPFDPPETGKIAVKVINHYGDEVLKVYEV